MTANLASPVVIPSILSAKDITKSYQDGKNITNVLNGLDIEVKAGEKIAIVGTSGSGKSTLLHILGGLDVPTIGEVWLHGKCMNQLNETERGNLRNQYLGFIYQFHHLLPEFTAIENVAMPLLLRSNVKISNAHSQAVDLLKRVGLEHRLTHRPGELSGGERQRVAIARALVTKPSLILADEPTGNLDHANALAVFEILAELQASLKTALLMVTHDRQLAGLADKQLALQNGRWVS